MESSYIMTLYRKLAIIILVSCLSITFDQVTKCDIEKFQAFYQAMLKEGIYLAPSAYEAGFVSSAHNESLIEETIAAAGRAFATL